MHEELLREYEGGAEQIARAVRDVPEHVLQVVPGPDKWSIHEILSHLADAEIVYSERVRRALADEDAKLIAFDESDWGDRLHYAERDPEASLQALRALRRSTADLLRHASGEEWDRTATHSQRGPTSVRDLIQAGIDHADYHLTQIAAIKSANGIR